MWLTLAVMAAGLAAWLLPSVFLNVEVDVPHGDAVPDAPVNPEVEAEAPEAIGAYLTRAGLPPAGRLGAIGVQGHCKRLDEEAVSRSELEEYSRNLRTIQETSERLGAALPLSFFDVETDAMKAAGWTCYKLARKLAEPTSEPYIRVLAECFERFLQFKDAEAAGTDTGLDAALDMMGIVKAYVDSMPKRMLAQHAPQIRDKVDHTLMGWQNIVAGTTRRNPLTKKPVFSHGFLERFNVVTLYEHHIGSSVGVSRAWGLAGFDDRYVGTPKNANQVEHMSISLLLQALFKQPVVMLNGVERAKLSAGSADEAETNADMALNTAIHEVFVPAFRKDLLGATEQLRARLKGS